MKNITLSADEKLIAAARAYARAHDTTLNELVRRYMEQLAGQKGRDQAADEFRQIATGSPGKSPRGWRFGRAASHRRGRNG